MTWLGGGRRKVFLGRERKMCRGPGEGEIGAWPGSCKKFIVQGECVV